MENQISPDEVISDVQDTPLQVQDTNISTDLQNAMWGDTPVEKPAAAAAADAPVVVSDPPKPTVNEEIFDQDVFIKNNFGYDTLDDAKKQIEELKNKAQTPAEIKFANEYSKNFFESIQEGKEDVWYDYLTNKKQIEKAEKTNVDNVKDAADLIKTYYQFKYKDFSQSEIADHFNDNYVKPDKPEPSDLQTDDEYAKTVLAWEQKCEAIDKRIVRDAKMFRPDFAQFKTELVLPEIPKTNQAAPTPTQEDLDKFKKQQEMFVQSAELSINGFNGFTAQVKDKDVDYAVSYAPSQEEKGLVSSKLKEFAESGFNANAILAERWLKEDGSINVGQMTEDLSRIYMGKNADAKFATESANKRMELYLKGRKNINIVDNPNSNVQQTEKPESERLQEAFWGN